MNHTDKNVILEEHIGKRIKWYCEDGSLFTGTILGILNEDHVRVLVDHKYDCWEWIVKSENVLFI